MVGTAACREMVSSSSGGHCWQGTLHGDGLAALYAGKGLYQANIYQV